MSDTQPSAEYAVCPGVFVDVLVYLAGILVVVVMMTVVIGLLIWLVVGTKNDLDTMSEYLRHINGMPQNGEGAVR